MIRTAALLAFCSTAAAADGWRADLRVTGAKIETHAIEGRGNSLIADAEGVYFSADAFADGVNEGGNCSTADVFEIDYFFGVETLWEGHVLFTLQRTGATYDVIDPTLYYSILDAANDVAATYAEFDGVQIAVTQLKCGADGTFDMAIAFKGRLLENYGDGPAAITVNGTSQASLLMLDMDDY